MSIVHYGIIDSSEASPPFLLLRAAVGNCSATAYPASSSYGRDSAASAASSSSMNMSSMVGSAISAIPGMNFLGKVFTSNDNASVSSFPS